MPAPNASNMPGTLAKRPSAASSVGFEIDWHRLLAGVGKGPLYKIRCNTYHDRVVAQRPPQAYGTARAQFLVKDAGGTAHCMLRWVATAAEKGLVERDGQRHHWGMKRVGRAVPAANIPLKPGRRASKIPAAKTATPKIPMSGSAAGGRRQSG